MAAATTKLLLSDLASTVESVTSNYIRPTSDRPNLTEVQISDGSIPLSISKSLTVLAALISSNRLDRHASMTASSR
ncbi:hypothetical protein AB3S75_047798 [Citrus x aurantiifolia]